MERMDKNSTSEDTGLLGGEGAAVARANAQAAVPAPPSPGDRVTIDVDGAECPDGTVLERHHRLEKSRVKWDDGLTTWVWNSALVLASTATSPTSEGEGIASDPRLATVKGSASVEAAPSPSGGKEGAGDGQA